MLQELSLNSIFQIFVTHRTHRTSKGVTSPKTLPTPDAAMAPEDQPTPLGGVQTGHAVPRSRWDMREHLPALAG